MIRVDLSDDTGVMFVVAAFRYALGRQSYIVSIIADILIGLVPQLAQKDRLLFVRDIDEAIARGEAGNPRIDQPYWLRVKAAMLGEGNECPTGSGVQSWLGPVDRDALAETRDRWTPTEVERALQELCTGAEIVSKAEILNKLTGLVDWGGDAVAESEGET